MTNSTMIAPGGFFFLEGDPLGVRALEDQLAWRSDGPLPEWLGGADPDVEPASSVEERMAAATLMLPSIPAPPPTLVVPTPIFAADYPSCVDSYAFENCEPVDEATIDHVKSEIAAAEVGMQTEVHERHDSTALEAPALADDPSGRRRPSLDELAQAHHCFIAEAAGTLWAVPLDLISYVSRKSRARNTIDLRAGQKSTLRDGVGIAVTLFADIAIRFDRSLGPRVVKWSRLPAASDAPRQAIAESVFSGVPLLLFDTQSPAKS